MAKRRGYPVNHEEEKTRQYLHEVASREQERAQLKQDLKKTKVSTQDQNDIGMLSSGWNAFRPTLKEHLNKTSRLGITRADAIAKHWNEIGYKTGSGKHWTPRLVNIAKAMFGIKHGLTIVDDKP